MIGKCNDKKKRAGHKDTEHRGEVEELPLSLHYSQVAELDRRYT